jgi:hypothetical protein
MVSPTAVVVANGTSFRIILSRVVQRHIFVQEKGFALLITRPAAAVFCLFIHPPAPAPNLWVGGCNAANWRYPAGHHNRVFFQNSFSEKNEITF